MAVGSDVVDTTGLAVGEKVGSVSIVVLPDGGDPVSGGPASGGPALGGPASGPCQYVDADGAGCVSTFSVRYLTAKEAPTPTKMMEPMRRQTLTKIIVLIQAGASEIQSGNKPPSCELLVESSVSDVKLSFDGSVL